MRLLKRLTLVLFAICALLRLFVGRARGLATNCGLALGAFRVVLIGVDVRAGRLPWQRILLPALILTQVLFVFAGIAEKSSSRVVLFAAELSLLAGVLVCARRAEDERVLASTLELFVPPIPARLIAAETTILGSAFFGIRKLFRIPIPPGGFGYTESSLFQILPVLLIFEAPFELLLVDRVLGITNIAIRAGLAALNVWGVLWVYGLCVTMKRRPHRIAWGELHLHQGVLGSASVPLRIIRDVQVDTSDRTPPRYARLTMPGAPKIRIVLNEPFRITKLFTGVSRPLETLYVSADQPEPFCQAIREERNKLSAALVN